MQNLGFDNDKYLKIQSAHIRERVSQFGGKLYLEFGGKLFDDFHASRVLPGFQPDSKIRMLTQLKEEVEVIVVINSSDVENDKRRGDLDLPYAMDVLRLIDAFRSYGLFVGSVVLTRFDGSPQVMAYQKKLEALGIRVYRHYTIPGYPSNIPFITSDEGYGKNDYIETTHSLVVVTAPGPGSGKMAVCLSQLYQENKRGVKAGYAKFETFPVWNLPLRHPVNLAYEAATIDLGDVNMIDPYHLEAYGKTTVNYNRDVAVFPILNEIFEKIYGSSPYQSPTDMGVNMIGSCIVDDAVVQKAARQEIIRRYYKELEEVCKGNHTRKTTEQLEILMTKAETGIIERPAVAAANLKAEVTGAPAAAILLPDGRVITGKTSPLMGASSAMVLNALKALAGVDENIELISPEIIEPIQQLKVQCLGGHNPHLHVEEVLIALTICAKDNADAAKSLAQIPGLSGCEMHSSVILSSVDERTFQKLHVNLTCEPFYQTKKLFDP